MFSSDNESSSSKEFQGSRYSRTGSRKSSKKTSKASQIDTALAGASNKGCYVEKHHSKSFKTYVMGILNECKHVCSEFRADMEHLKQKCYRKETLHLERANRMVYKSCNIIDKLKAALDEHQTNLKKFHTSWSARYEAQNNNNKKVTKEDDKKSLQSDNETTEKEKPCENRSIITDVKGKKKNTVSDCDSDTIFSDDKSKKASELKCSDDLSADSMYAKCFDTSSSDEELFTNESTTGKGPDCPDRTSPILGNSRQAKVISTSPNAEALKESTECIIKKSNTTDVAATELTPPKNNEKVINPKERNNRTDILEEVNKYIDTDISFSDDKDRIGTSLKDSFINSLDSMLDTMNCAAEENCIDKGSDTSTVYNSNENNAVVDNSLVDVWTIKKMQNLMVNDTTEKENPEEDNNSQDDTSINQKNLIEAPNPTEIKNTITSNDDSTHKEVTKVAVIKHSKAIEPSTLIEENIPETEECTPKSPVELAADLSPSHLVVSQSSLGCNASHKNKKMHEDSYVSDSSCSTIELPKGKEKKMCGKESKSKCTKIENIDTLNPYKEKILLHASDDEEAAKKLLLESNSDDSIIAPTCPFSEIKKNNKGTINVLSDDNTTNLQAKQELLETSGSDTSNSDQGLENRTTDIVHTNTKGIFVKQISNWESDDSVGSRVKRRKLKLCDNIHYMRDKKLQAQCRVLLVNLNKEILQHYTPALEKSRLYQEDKALNRLVNLDALECKHKKYITNSEITRENNSSSRATCKRKGQLEQDSLLDHLKKVENGEIFKNTDVILDTDESNSPTIMTTPLLTNEELASEADRVAKNILLHSSDSNTDEDIQFNDKSDSKPIEAVTPKEILKRSGKNKKQQSCKESDEEQASQRSKWKRNKLLTAKFSDSDSDQERQKWIMSQERQKEKNNMDDSDSGENICKIKRKRPRRILNSDSDFKITGSDSSTVSSCLREEKSLSDADKTRKEKTKRKTRKRGIQKSSDTDSSSSDKKTKQRRKRIKKMASDSDNESDAQMNSQGTPSKSGRKNIRKVLKDKQVADDTKQAAKEEEERVQRIAERQKVYNEMYEARLAGEEKVQNLVLDFDPNTKAELISVHKSLVKRLKPHQAEGIKFMWDACFESIERLKTTKGSGCIIAHCMGLGKTLQVITLTHTLLNYEITNVRTVMVVCPLSTVLNWVHEFDMWLKDVDDADIEIYELTRLKKNNDRKYQLQSWQRTGGVLIIGYDMFRNLTGPNTKMRKGMKDSILECLIDPGPDLIVCDEGHLLKNEDTALSKCMKRVKTLRRIVLTGTPLQNNLKEYHCMVQFVKPNLLGTRKEFLNRFVNPITNGQFDDSTAYDVKLMKKRAHVLHKMLEGSVQRFDYSVLTPFLPPKQEYVIFVRLTDVQIKMYQFYLDNFARRHVGVGGSLFADFQALQRIWTHPRVLQLNAEKVEKTNERKLASSDSEGSLKDFINDDSLSDSSQTSNTDDSDIQCVQDSNEMSNLSKPNTKTTNAVSDEAEVVLEETHEEKVWWSQFIQPEHFTDMRMSAKLMLLFAILKESEQIGDKILVFSQSLYSLTLIENFLEYIDNETQKDSTPDFLEGHSGSWSLGLDYFRLDGQTSAENRKIWCNIFNKPSNNRARLFLISTRAGGLGINLTAANRVIIFDASWNPSHDVQSIFRVYRFGQRKPCYVYRFLASGTMEEKIYNRQVTKLSLSCRVVDEQQIERHYSNNDLTELYKFEAYANENRPTLNLPKDRLLANIFLKYKEFVENYHEHDSLLENKAEEELDEEERKQAWLEYEQEKHTGFVQQTPMMAGHQPNILMNQFNVITNIDQGNMGPQTPMHNEYKNLEQLIRKDYPNATEEQQKFITAQALTDMYNYWEKQAMLRSPKYYVPTPRLPMLNVTTNVKPYQYYPVQNQPPSNPYLLKLLQQQQPQQQQQQQQQHGNTQVNHSALNAKRPNMFGSSTVPTHPDEHDVVEVPISKTTVPSVAGIQNPAPSTSKNQEE